MMGNPWCASDISLRRKLPVSHGCIMRGYSACSGKLERESPPKRAFAVSMGER